MSISNETLTSRQYELQMELDILMEEIYINECTEEQVDITEETWYDNNTNQLEVN